MSGLLIPLALLGVLALVCGMVARRSQRQEQDWQRHLPKSQRFPSRGWW